MSARLELYVEKRIKTLINQGCSYAEIVERLKVYFAARKIFQMIEEAKS
jgi:hypothetical protein